MVVQTKEEPRLQSLAVGSLINVITPRRKALTNGMIIVHISIGFINFCEL